MVSLVAIDFVPQVNPKDLVVKVNEKNVHIGASDTAAKVKALTCKIFFFNRLNYLINHYTVVHELVKINNT